jgi:hypothetical protein
MCFDERALSSTPGEAGDAMPYDDRVTSLIEFTQTTDDPIVADVRSF